MTLGVNCYVGLPVQGSWASNRPGAGVCAGGSMPVPLLAEGCDGSSSGHEPGK